MDWKEVFPQFEPELADTIEKEAERKTIQAGEVLIRKGQYIRLTMLVVSGCIKIYRESDEGEEFFLYYIAPGEAYIGSVIYTSQLQVGGLTAIAEEDTDILMIPVPLMIELMKKYKSCNEFIAQTYLGRLDDLLTVIDNIAFRSMDERLEFYLKRHAEKSGKNTIELSHQQIADDLNSSREVVSRLLKKMEQRKMIRLQRNMIELLQTALPEN